MQFKSTIYRLSYPEHTFFGPPQTPHILAIYLRDGCPRSFPVPACCRRQSRRRPAKIPAIIIMSIKLLVTATVVVQWALSQQIVDYSHSDYLERRQAQPHHNYNIDIHPAKDKKDYLEFPQTCALESSLPDSALADSAHTGLDSEERQIERLKANMTHLLTLAEAIKRAKSFLKQYSFNSFEQDLHYEVMDPSSLELIQAAQSSLQQKRKHIDSLVQQLAELIHKELNGSKRNGFAEMQLKFEHTIYQSRLSYLLKLQDALRQAKPTPSSNFDLFFDEAQQSLARDQHELAAVADLLAKYSTSNELKLKISNLQNQLEALHLMIQEKEACFDKKTQYLQDEGRKELERTYNELKILKRTETPNSEFCEGVTASLLKQLKKVLKVYNYSFACAQGLPELRNSRYILLLELQRLNASYHEIDYDNKVEAIRRFLAAQEQLRAELIEEVHKFKLKQYSLEAETLSGEIEGARRRLGQIESQIKAPSQPSEQVNYAQIRQIIDQIEQQQHAYCQLKDHYQQQYRALDVSLKVLEHLSALKTAQYANYVARYNELRELERQFLEVRTSIVEQLQ